MPYDRKHVTRASRIAIPAHLLFSTALGAVWLAQDGTRTAVPALAALRDLWPIQSTGLVLCSLGVLGAIALLTKQRVLGGLALAMGALAFLGLAVATAWPLLTTLSVSYAWPLDLTITTGPGSYSAPLWPLYVATCHVASLISVALDEGNEDVA